MNARSVSMSAARKLGALLFIMCAFAALLPAASKIYVLSQFNRTQVTAYDLTGKRVEPSITLGSCLCTNLAVDDSGIYVTNQMPKNQVMIFHPDGTPMRSLSIGANYAIAFDAGRIITLAQDVNRNGVVKIFTSDWKFIPPAIKTGLNSADAVAIDKTGKIYVLSQGYNVIKAFDANGQMVGPVIRNGVNTPRSMAMGPDGTIYVANYVTVSSYLPNGERRHWTVSHTNSVTGGLDSPMALATDAAGRLYVGYDTGLVGVFGPDGKATGDGFMTQKGIIAIAVH